MSVSVHCEAISLARLKVVLLPKVIRRCGMDYKDTSPVAKPTSVRILISLAVTCHWPLYQLDINNAFLNGVLDE